MSLDGKQMSSRFYKALALAIGFEAMLVGSLLCIGSHASTILKAVEAVMYLIGSIAGLTWCFYEWGADERKNR
nr:MAG TPA: hypothetical protein [Caudoviricetes sp.]